MSDQGQRRGPSRQTRTGGGEPAYSPEADAALDAARSSAVVFFPDPRRLTRLVFWNTVATFLTLGFYRFWARTRLRRHFWHRVMVAGASGEYLGRGMELFLGFIIVFALLGLTFTVFMLGAFFATTRDIGADLISAVFYGAILLVAPAALYRARRYRLTRTVWRGIRFGQDGSSLHYMTIWLGWLVLTLLTAGFAYPWRNVAVERYRINTTRLGNTFFEVDARASDLIGAWLPAWLTGLGLMGALAGLFGWWSLYQLIGAPGAAINNPPIGAPLADFYAISPAVWAGAALVFGIGFYYALVRYRTEEFRYFIARLTLGAARFRSDLTARQVRASVTPFALGAFGFLVISFGLVALIVQVVAGLPGESAVDADVIALALMVLITAVAMLFAASYGITLLFNVTMRTRLIGAIAASFTIEGVDAVDDIVQDSQNAPRFGEGLADAFNFGNF